MVNSTHITNHGVHLTLIGLGVNILLFLVKLYTAIISGSIAVLSDALNSLSDIFTSSVTFIAVRVGASPKDKAHPFGHHRAEPIAALLIALVAGILAIEITKRTIESLFSPQQLTVFPFVYGLVLFTILAKLLLAAYYYHYSKKHNSPAILALAKDSRNDILASCLVFISLFFTQHGIVLVDSIISLIIAGIIAFTGYNIYKENINYLMGKSPDNEVLLHYESVLLQVKGILGIKRLRAQYIGNTIQIDACVFVDKKRSAKQVEQILRKATQQLESLPSVSSVFLSFQLK
ncbi:MAG: cation diffusion facilitator family transporter [Candidatus Woesearchaeota archaeon]